MRMVPYIRTSTDDKGQDPERQMVMIRHWAHREDVQLLEAFIDEGTSATKTNPLERPKFQAACEAARAARAAGIVIETDDRFSRQGTKLAGWAETEMELVYGIKLYRADIPLAQHDELAGDLMSSVGALLAREWARKHALRVKGGMERRKAKGLPIGRKPKALTEAELELAIRLRGEGVGWPTVALRVTQARGAHDVADIKLQRERRVSGPTVRRAVERWLGQNQVIENNVSSKGVVDAGS